MAASQVRQQLAPSVSFINLRLLSLLPCTQAHRDVQLFVSNPGPNHFCCMLISGDFWWDSKFALHIEIEQY